MAILNIKTSEVGLVGVKPNIVYIDTNDTIATVTTAGYLNQAVQNGASFSEWDMALVSTKTTPNASNTQVGWLEVSRSGSTWSLVPGNTPGSVVLPTVANRLAHFTNTTGTLSGAAADVTNLGDLTLGASGVEGVLTLYPAGAAEGTLGVKTSGHAADSVVNFWFDPFPQNSTIFVRDSGASEAAVILTTVATSGQTIAKNLTLSTGNLTLTTGNLGVSAGTISGGLAAGGFAGNLILHANTTASGNLALLTVDNATGDFDTIISNAAAVAQDQTITIPDAGAATANFLLDKGADNIRAYQQFVGISNILLASSGTWVNARNAQGDYGFSHVSSSGVVTIGIDITEPYRVIASKGFRLNSIDVSYAITTNPVTSHTAVLDLTSYANNTANLVTSVPMTGTLATAAQALPYLTNFAVDTPAFNVTANSHYIFEIAVEVSTAGYEIYGLVLNFDRTIG